MSKKQGSRKKVQERRFKKYGSKNKGEKINGNKPAAINHLQKKTTKTRDGCY
jgi:hypothetical protein